MPVIPDQPPLLDGRLKKIFVFEQDVFRPASANDLRVVAVRTPAFDLSGFGDLTQLRAGDVVEIETAVSVAGRPHSLFDRQRFDRLRLVTLADFARGENRLSGTDIRVTLRQPQSGDGGAVSPRRPSRRNGSISFPLRSWSQSALRRPEKPVRFRP